MRNRDLSVGVVIAQVVAAPTFGAARDYVETLPPVLLAALEDQLYIEYPGLGRSRKQTRAARIVKEARA